MGHDDCDATVWLFVTDKKNPENLGGCGETSQILHIHLNDNNNNNNNNNRHLCQAHHRFPMFRRLGRKGTRE